MRSRANASERTIEVDVRDGVKANGDREEDVMVPVTPTNDNDGKRRARGGRERENLLDARSRDAVESTIGDEFWE